MTSPTWLAALAEAYAPLTVVRRLAVGGTAEVHLCAHDDGTQVVVKHALNDAPRHRALLVEEGAALGAIDHPNVVPCLAQVPGALVLPMLPGQTLAAVLEGLRRRGRRLPLPAFAALFDDLRAGLAATHAAAYAHGDLNPNNVIISPEGGVTLIDFGLALRLTAQAATVLGAGGTLAYMAPEQLEGRAVTAATDVYALALVAYAALAGGPWLPRPQPSIGELLISRRGAPPPIPGLPEALDQAVRSALVWDPKLRPALADWAARVSAHLPDAQRQALAADQATGSTAAQHTVQPPRLDAPPPPATSGASLAWALSSVLLIALVLAAWRPWRRPEASVVSTPAIVVDARVAPDAGGDLGPPPPARPPTAPSAQPASAPIAKPPVVAPRRPARATSAEVRVQGLGSEILIRANGADRFGRWSTRLSAQRPAATAVLHGAVSATLHLQWVDGQLLGKVLPMYRGTTTCPVTPTALDSTWRCTVVLGAERMRFEVRRP